MSATRANSGPQTAPLHVAWVASADTLPSLGHFLRPLAGALADAQTQLTLLCPPVEEGLLPPDVNVIHYRPRCFWALHADVLKDLGDQLKQRKVSLLHALDASSAALAGRLAKMTNHRYVVSSYGLGDCRRLGHWGRGAAAIMTASEAIHERLRRIWRFGPRRVRLVRPGLATAPGPSCFLDDGRPIAIVIGGDLRRFRPFHAALRSLAELIRREYDCMGFVLGSGRAERRLRVAAERLGLMEQLTFAGDQPSVRLPGIFEAADIYVCAATDGAVELSSLLAMASGIPVVVAGDLTGDFVLEGKTALRFLVGGTNVLTGKLTSLLDDHAAARELADQALSYLREKHSTIQAATHTREIYQEAAGPPPK